MLWPRREMLSEARHRLLRRYTGPRPLRELPEALRQVRECVWVHSAYTHTGSLSLLWDDPNRVPEQADVPLDAIPLEFPT